MTIKGCRAELWEDASRLPHCSRRAVIRALACLLLLSLIGLIPAVSLAKSTDGQSTFQQLCVPCHNFGGGPQKTGPDLKGVTMRREREWLRRWIKEPDKMLAAGDPIATQLLKEYKNVPMPSFKLTDEQVEAIIAYLESMDAAPTTSPSGTIPPLYYPTLITAIATIGVLTALGLLSARKQVEVRS